MAPLSENSTRRERRLGFVVLPDNNAINIIAGRIELVIVQHAIVHIYTIREAEDGVRATRFLKPRGMHCTKKNYAPE